MEMIIRLTDKMNKQTYLDMDSFKLLADSGDGHQSKYYKENYDTDATTSVKLNIPYPGNYIVGATVEPTKLEGAMKVSIPQTTLEPWQVHFQPFEELIIVKNGTMFVKQITFEGDEYRTKCETYDAGDEVKILKYVPHQLGNPKNDNLDLIAEWSPGPEWNESLEPEFPSLNACLTGLYKELIKNADKNI